LTCDTVTELGAGAGSARGGVGSEEAPTEVVSEGDSVAGTAELGVGMDTVIGAIVMGCVFLATGTVGGRDTIAWLMGATDEIGVFADIGLLVDMIGFADAALAAVVSGTTGIPGMICNGFGPVCSVCSIGLSLLDVWVMFV